MPQPNLPTSTDPRLAQLQQAMVGLRWLVVAGLWLLILPGALWAVRDEIQLLRSHFTWVGLRYAIAYNPWVAFGLSLCLGMTTSVLVWQSRNILFGRPQREQYRLQQLLERIERQGRRHPLWHWVHREQS
ncbi:MAG: hypothetical protein ACPGVO_13770 [Spirulinaceae cyanobacterium]